MPARHPSRLPLLGERTPAAFLARFWHKEALLVRAAVPGFGSMFNREELQSLAARDDVESRVVLKSGTRWELTHGPFRKADFRQLPQRGWTLMVQGVNLHDARADALLRRFSFVPFARLDDLMITFAVPGGGVGPHFDSYDVFLLQGFGRRRWRYGRQADLSLRPGLPVKILRRFVPRHDDVLNPGDMLYLPPAYAHDGVAIDACTTFSIGFRAPSHTELAQAFLDHLRDRLELPGRYADPDLRATREPARVARTMQRRVAAALRGVRWNQAVVDRFLGTMLSEPKAEIVFDPPSQPLTRAAFERAVRRRGAHLDRRTCWLYDDDALYVNGEAHAWPPGDRGPLVQFANGRLLSATDAALLAPAGFAFLYEGYRHGYLHIA